MYYKTPSCPVCLAKVLQLPRSPYWGFASGLTPGPLQSASNLEQVVCSGQISLLPSAGREMSSSYGYGVKA